MSCGEIQDRIPDRAAGRMEASEAVRLDRHLAGCADCREVFETVRLLGATRPSVPEGLEARILAAVRAGAAPEEGGASVAPAPSGPGAPVPAPPRSPGPSAPRWSLLRGLPAWGWAAAAGLALAVGLPVLTDPDAEDPAPVGALALADEGVGGVWLDDDLMVAGAPAVSELSDEALQALLEEFER